MKKVLSGKSLSFRLFLYTILISLILSFIAGGIQLWFNYNKQIDSIKVSMNNLENTFTNSIIYNLWNLNESILNEQIADMRKTPDIHIIKLDTSRTLIPISKSDIIISGNKLTKRIPLYNISNDRQYYLGTLIMQTDLSILLKENINKLLLEVILDTLKIFFISLSVFLIVSFLIKPLMTITEYLNTTDPELSKPLEIKRKKSNDEIDLLIDAIHNIREDIRNKIDDINQTHQELQYKNIELKNLYEELIDSHTKLENSYFSFSTKLAVIAEKYDDITGNHIERVARYSEFIAEKLNLSKIFTADIKYYSCLHDIGKLFIDKDILNKPGKLSFDEFEEMKKHTFYGSNILDDDENFAIAKNIALYHHERYNGTGYPYGLSKDNIPIEARIVALADVYDALRGIRPYKRGFTHEEAYDIIIYGDDKTSPSQFDPQILKIFKEHHLEFDSIFSNSEYK